MPLTAYRTATAASAAYTRLYNASSIVGSGVVMLDGGRMFRIAPASVHVLDNAIASMHAELMGHDAYVAWKASEIAWAFHAWYANVDYERLKLSVTYRQLQCLAAEDAHAEPDVYRPATDRRTPVRFNRSVRARGPHVDADDDDDDDEHAGMDVDLDVDLDVDMNASSIKRAAAGVVDEPRAKRRRVYYSDSDDGDDGDWHSTDNSTGDPMYMWD